MRAAGLTDVVGAENAGVEGSVVVEKVREGSNGVGFNASTLKYEDLVRSGIIDPTKVVRSALQNACSIAGLLIMTEAVVAEIPEKEDEGHGHHHH